jgi:bla regulator protein blaR1
LRKRIEGIMTGRGSVRLSTVRKVALALAGCTAVAAPLAIGILQAQTLPAPPTHGYEVVSIRPAAPGEQNSRIGPGPQGGLRAQNNTIINLLCFAYDVRNYQFSNVPGWVRSDRYDITLTPDKPEVTPHPGMSREQAEALFKRHRERMKAVFRDRFGLVLRAETKELPIYALTIAKGGHKLVAPKGENSGPLMRAGTGLRMNNGEISATAAYLSMLTPGLAGILGRPVLNETGLDGPFDFTVKWTPDPGVRPQGAAEAPASGDEASSSLFTALQEQLGLKLESKRGPVPLFVIEKIEKPTEN